jgi:hypothetical protein
MSIMSTMIRKFPDVPAVELLHSMARAEAAVRQVEPKFWDRLEKLFKEEESGGKRRG